MEDRILSDAQCLDPLKRDKRLSPERASRLTEDLIDAIGEENSKNLFNVEDHFSKHSLMDKVKHEYKCYQIEDVDGFYDISANKEKDHNHTPRQSYWKEAYGQLKIDYNTTSSEVKYCGIDEYWWKIGTIKDENGHLKFKALSALMLGICTLSHGNADPERGFSINKHMLDTHGTSTSKKTIEALRFVKDYVILNGSVNNMTIPKELIKICSQARQRLEDDLKAEREAKRIEEDARRQLNKQAVELQKQKSEESEMFSNLKKLDKKLKISNDLLNEGQNELEELTKSDKVNRVKLLSANAKITTSLKRKAELQKEKDQLSDKLIKLKK